MRAEEKHLLLVDDYTKKVEQKQSDFTCRFHNNTLQGQLLSLIRYKASSRLPRMALESPVLDLVMRCVTVLSVQAHNG